MRNKYILKGKCLKINIFPLAVNMYAMTIDHDTKMNYTHKCDMQKLKYQ